MKDLVGRGEVFITVLMWLSEICFALKSAFDSCLPVETFDAKLFKEKLLKDQCQSSEAK